jgi:hypothetical protein
MVAGINERRAGERQNHAEDQDYGGADGLFHTYALVYHARGGCMY